MSVRYRTALRHCGYQKRHLGPASWSPWLTRLLELARSDKTKDDKDAHQALNHALDQIANKSISTTIGEAISKTKTAGNLDQPRKMQSDSLKFAPSIYE